MYRNANDAYLENRVLSADPIELVRMLYQAADGAVRAARGHLAAGDIAARSNAIVRACDILAELTGSLDRDRGGEIADRLAQLYDYITRRLVEANTLQQDAPLAEALGLLGTLEEGWDGVQQALQTAVPAPTPAPNPWEQPAPPDPAPAFVSNPWSGGSEAAEPAYGGANSWGQSRYPDQSPGLDSHAWSF
jgi:flagellar protein FliS